MTGMHFQNIGLFHMEQWLIKGDFEETAMQLNAELIIEGVVPGAKRYTNWRDKWRGYNIHGSEYIFHLGVPLQHTYIQGMKIL